MKGYADGPGIGPNKDLCDIVYPTVRKHMVEEGLYLHRHYAASVCSPSRKQLLTGRAVWSQVRSSRLSTRLRAPY